MNATELVDGYRLAREAQLRRFDVSTQGVDRSCGRTAEWERFFGAGEHMGAGAESALTLPRYLSGLSEQGREHDPLPLPDDDAPLFTAAELLRWPGSALRSLAAEGDVGAVAELERREARRAARRAARAGVG